MRKIPALIAMSLLASPAHAGFYTGNEMLGLCQSSSEVDQAYCTGVVAGTLGLLALNDKACPPKGVTLTQIKDVTVKSLIENPKTRHQSSEVEVERALRAAFPC